MGTWPAGGQASALSPACWLLPGAAAALTTYGVPPHSDPDVILDG